MANEQGAMFDEFSEGGLLDDADVTIKSARFTQWDYRGKVTAPVLALQLILTDAEGKDHEEYLSSGELRFFVPSADGKKALPVGSQQKLNNNTNAVAFLLSLMNADTKGELAGALKKTDDISIIDGVQLHVVRKAQPKRGGIIQQPGADGNTREARRLEVEKVIAYAGAVAAPKAAAVKGAAAAPAAAAPAAAAAGNEEMDNTAAGLLLTLVTENGNALVKTSIAGKLFGMADVKAMPAPQRNALLAHITKDAFLASETVTNFGLTYDPATKTVSVAG